MTWIPNKLTESQLPYIPQVTVNTVGELYDTFIKPQLPSADVVRHWHRLLLNYVTQPDAILFVRRYASADKTEYHRLRRGFLTLDPTGFGYAYCDNYLPQLIFAQVLAGNKPTLAELQEAVANRRFPVSVRLAKPERAQSAFGWTTAPPFGERGWKLSHLHHVNAHYSFDYRRTVDELFPRGEYNWWGNPDKVYRLTQAVSSDHRQKMVAHFLRAVHPANYFLSPAKKWQASGGQDVGENLLLLTYVQQRFQEIYGDVLLELEPLLLATELQGEWTAPETPLELVVRRPVKGKKTGVIKPENSESAKTRRTVRMKPYPITYSIGDGPEVDEQAFLQQVLVTKYATITRHFHDGTASIELPWNARDLTPSSNLTNNLRGRFRTVAQKANIARLHVAVRAVD
ncbi:hypothetical protein [Hymenobacter sp. 102]|uniref:hypothetical protein n=1 Tax=Hymenobacter sp. 102 TaxID=3403152 RepID=UPI003CE6AC64